MENTMEKTNNTVDVTYQGAIFTITVEEFENLRDGWVTFEEMFG